MRIRTNNALERIMRRSETNQSRGSLPGRPFGADALRGRLRHVAGTQWGSKRYLNMDLMRDQDIDKALELAEAI